MSRFQNEHRRSPEYLHSSGSSESPPPHSSPAVTRMPQINPYIPHETSHSRHTPINTSPRSTSAMSSHSQETPREYPSEHWRPDHARPVDHPYHAGPQQPPQPQEPWAAHGYPGPEWMTPSAALPPYQPNQYQQAPSGNMAQQGQPPRQRTSIACRYCRKRKIRCSGYSNNPGGKCINCTRMNQECVFQPVNSSNNSAAFVHISALHGHYPSDMPVFGAYGQPLNAPPVPEPHHRQEPMAPRPTNNPQYDHHPPPGRTYEDPRMVHPTSGGPALDRRGWPVYPSGPPTNGPSVSRASPPTTQDRESRPKEDWTPYPGEDDRRGHALPPISDRTFPPLETREGEGRPGIMKVSHLLDSSSDVDRHMLNRLGRGGRM